MSSFLLAIAFILCKVHVSDNGQLGAYMSNKIESAQWGDSVVQQLAEYITHTAPELKGFSAQNLWRMKQFYEAYRNADEKLSPLLREIVPSAEQVFRDQYVMEFIGGKEYKTENSMKSALVLCPDNHRCIA